MKRFSLAVVLGLTVMLLAWAPQLRADGTDHFDNDKGNAVTAMSSSHGEKALHAHAWKDDDDDGAKGNLSGSSNSGSSSQWGGNSNEGSGSSPGSGSMNAPAPEPSSLFLLLSGLLAAAVGLKLRKAAA